MCLIYTNQDRTLTRLELNTFTEKLKKLQKEGHLSQFLLEQFLTYGRLKDERN